MLLHSSKLFLGQRQQKGNAEESNGTRHLDSKVSQVKLAIDNAWVRQHPLNNSGHGHDRYTAPFDIGESLNGAGQEFVPLRLFEKIERWPQNHAGIKQPAE